MSYQIMSKSEIGNYVARQKPLSVWGSVLSVDEISDGYLNNVFRVSCERGSLILKQSMPYVRVDPSWPLTPSRIAQESASYQAWNQLAPGFAPQVHLFDSENFVLVEEDLVGHVVWRDALNNRQPFADGAVVLGRFAARVAVNANAEAVIKIVQGAGTNDLSANPAMRQLMEDVIFSFPYVDHPNNAYPAAVTNKVDTLRSDPGFRGQVEDLHRAWSTNRESLIHGDLHTGSVMVAPGSVKVIDAEFSLFGPVSWDLGELLGNLLMALIRGELLQEVSAELCKMPASLWQAFTEELTTAASDSSGDVPGTDWLGQTRTEMYGYAGLEMIRRVIGSGKALDLTTLPGALQGRAASAALSAGRALVEQRAGLDPAKCVELVGRAVTES